MALTASCYQFSKKTEVLWAAETAVCFGLFFVLLVTVLGQSGRSAADHAALYAITFGITALSVGIYRTEIRSDTRLLLTRAVAAAVLSLPAVGLISYLVPIDLGTRYSADRAAELLLSWTAAILAMRVLFGLALRSSLFSRRVLVLGASPAIALIRGEGGSVYDVRGPAVTNPATPLQLQGIWALVYDPASFGELPPDLAATCRQRGIKVLHDGAFLESCLRRIDLPATPTVPTFDRVGSGRRSGAAPGSGGWTRAFDVAAAVLLLLGVLPIMLLTALAIRLDDGGPVFYRQSRVGLHGHEFTLFKFRSMRIDAEARGPVWAQQQDPRVTGIGALIRRLRIDELPQILNILRGEMSIVGPRPERPHFVAQLAAAIPRYAERAQVKPGLTGWAQVNYPYGASIEDARAKLSYDLYYVGHRSALLNLLTLFATIRVVMFQEGSR